jgi:hypothetical protein
LSVTVAMDYCVLNFWSLITQYFNKIDVYFGRRLFFAYIYIYGNKTL